MNQAARLMAVIEDSIPRAWSATLFLKWFGLTRIPLIFHVGASVEEISDSHVVVRIPFARRNRNHVGSMYFGVLAAGADISAGYLAMDRIRRMGKRIQFVFKDFHAEFLRRAEGDVLFRCDEGQLCTALVDEAVSTGRRVEGRFHVSATVPSVDPDTVVARFELTISLKASR